MFPKNVLTMSLQAEIVLSNFFVIDISTPLPFSQWNDCTHIIPYHTSSVQNGTRGYDRDIGQNWQN